MLSTKDVRSFFFFSTAMKVLYKGDIVIIIMKSSSTATNLEHCIRCTIVARITLMMASS